MSDRRSPLDEALRALEEEDAALGASADVAERLRAEVRAIGRTKRLRQYLIGATAAALLLAAVLTSRLRTPEPARAPITTGEVTTGFFSLTDGDVPVTSGHIVRMEVPRASLAAFGLEPFDPGADRLTVVADVVVGEDGLARAVRFVRATNQ